MSTVLAVLMALFALAAAAGWVVVVRHAFRQSLGTGFMVLTIPLFALYYAAVGFEHPRKSFVVASLFAGGFGAAVLISVALTTLQVAPTPARIDWAP